MLQRISHLADVSSSCFLFVTFPSFSLQLPTAFVQYFISLLPTVLSSLSASASHSISITLLPLFPAAHTAYCFSTSDLTQVISSEWWHLKSCWDSFSSPKCLIQNVPCACTHGLTQILSTTPKHKHTRCKYHLHKMLTAANFLHAPLHTSTYIQATNQFYCACVSRLLLLLIEVKFLLQLNGVNG